MDVKQNLSNALEAGKAAFKADEEASYLDAVTLYTSSAAMLREVASQVQPSAAVPLLERAREYDGRANLLKHHLRSIGEDSSLAPLTRARTSTALDGRSAVRIPRNASLRDRGAPPPSAPSPLPEPGLVELDLCDNVPNTASLAEAGSDEYAVYADLGAAPKRLDMLQARISAVPAPGIAVLRWEHQWSGSTQRPVLMRRTRYLLWTDGAPRPTHVHLRAEQAEEFSSMRNAWERRSDPLEEDALSFAIDSLGRYSGSPSAAGSSASAKAAQRFWWNAVEMWTQVPAQIPPNADVQARLEETVGCIAGRDVVDDGVPALRLKRSPPPARMPQQAEWTETLEQRALVEAESLRPHVVHLVRVVRDSRGKLTRLVHESYLFCWRADRTRNLNFSGAPLLNTDRFYRRAKKRLGVELLASGSFRERYGSLIAERAQPRSEPESTVGPVPPPAPSRTASSSQQASLSEESVVLPRAEFLRLGARLRSLEAEVAEMRSLMDLLCNYVVEGDTSSS